VQKIKWITVLVVWLAAGNLLAQAGRQETKGAALLDALQEKRALQSLLKIAEKEILPAVDAMPADKFAFAPTDGEFKGVRTFGQMVKHLSATNHILAAAALGEEPPADAGDEVGPEAVRTKAEILNYLNGSFTHLSKAIEAIGQTSASVNLSPISPLKRGEVTRAALVVESLMHAYDHYGQIVEYLRMNGVVPPASRP
jgi:uncharacterized damage-inducible protein DinB